MYTQWAQNTSYNNYKWGEITTGLIITRSETHLFIRPLIGVIHFTTFYITGSAPAHHCRKRFVLYTWIFQFSGAEWMLFFGCQQKEKPQTHSFGFNFGHPKLEVIGI